jgi:hypothetical protein
MKTINIRFLKQGLLEVEVPEDSTVEDMLELGKQALDNASDQDLQMAMQDIMPNFKALSVSRFDADSFQVEAIEIDEDGTAVYTTPLWNLYAFGSSDGQ